MSHIKKSNEKSDKKAPARNLKEKRADKAAKRQRKESTGSLVIGGLIPNSPKK